MTQARPATGQPSAAQAFTRVVKDLHGQGRLRVWSIIISALGDLALPRGAALPASALQEVMDALGIEPGAVRTAISRLAKEGWITRDRDGRNISYKVAEAAVPEFDMASLVIYGSERPEPAGEPVLLIGPEVHELREGPCLIPLRRDAALAMGDLPKDLPETTLALRGTVEAFPGWTADALAPAALAAQFQGLETSFAPLSSALDGGDALGPVQAVAARVALIHSWRRAVLRHAAVPSALLPRAWPEPACRRYVHNLYARLATLATPWLDRHMPQDDKSVTKF